MNTVNETLEARGKQYGDFGEVAELAQQLKKMLVVGAMVPVQREAMDLICTKLARLATGNPDHRDSWVDIAGYAQLAVLELDSR